MFKQQCSVDVQVLSGVALVSVLGELDLATTPLLQDRLRHLERTDVETIMLDLHEATFLDCSAIMSSLLPIAMPNRTGIGSSWWERTH